MFIIKLLTIMSKALLHNKAHSFHHYRLNISTNPVNCCHVLHYLQRYCRPTKSQYGSICHLMCLTEIMTTIFFLGGGIFTYYIMGLFTVMKLSNNKFKNESNIFTLNYYFKLNLQG